MSDISLRSDSFFFWRKLVVLLSVFLFASSLMIVDDANAAPKKSNKQIKEPVAEVKDISEVEDVKIDESELGSKSIFARALQGGVVVFSCLMILVLMSILSWAVCVAKWISLKKLQETNDDFIKSFWDSRSLNDLNSRLQEYAYSPVREVFRSGYSELVRGSQLRDQAATNEMAISAAMDNLSRALNKAKLFEKRRMEKYLQVLAISASASPFIGLFGTVWGIMGAFEGIARTGSASLAAVAPGISEALIATAFGLAAAIPAVIGYNLFVGKIRFQLANIDGFAADFLNIVERYLVTDRPKSGNNSSSQSPLSDKI